MIFTTVIAIAGLFSQGAEVTPVSLDRVFTKGEKIDYEYSATLQQESRSRGLDTWLPVDIDLSYRFTSDVTSLKPDGSAVILYKRDPMKQVVEAPGMDQPQVMVDKTKMNLTLTVSPANEILVVKDNDAKAKEKEKEKEKGKDKNVVLMRSMRQAQNIDNLLPQLTQGLYQILVFIGSVDSGLDFAPKLPFEEVKPGDTWKRTVGYSPQKTSDKTDKMAMQRLDFTFSYVGVVEVGKTKFHRVHGVIELKTDLGNFMNQSMGTKPEQSLLKSMPFTLKSQIDYDLDLKTRRTIKSVATSEATAQIFLTLFDDAYEETKFKGKAVLKPFVRKPVKN